MITFITPHQRPTSGGVYAILQLAAHLASTMNVNLVVQNDEPMQIPGVVMYKSKSLLPDEIPDANIVILHADSTDGENFANLPPAKGKRFLYFQGYGTPGNGTVIENLKRTFSVIASAKWLVDEASRYGSNAAYVPYGLNYDIFSPGSPLKRKDNRITMMTHHLDWKGTSDGMEALRIVIDARPDIEVCLFGAMQPEFPGDFIPSPSRESVGSLLKESSVFVCSSWEEGFGMPGLEAMACGAALATTDTKGSRDYAFDGETALVTPPRKPEALAISILKLLDDNKLRKRITDTGIDYIKNHYNPWPVAARIFEKSLSL